MNFSRFLYSVNIFFFVLFSSLALADDGLYMASFDPIQLGQLDASLKAKEKFGYGRIVLMVDPDSNGTESLETRWMLLKESVKDNPSFFVPPLEDIQALKNLKGKKNWDRFLQKYQPTSGKYQPLVDRTNAKNLINIYNDRRVTYVSLFGGDDTSPLNTRGYVKVNLDPASAKEYRKDPLLHESWLPKGAAREIYAKKLYGRAGERGFYELPENVVNQLDLEQRLNDRIEDTSKFASINSSDLPMKYYPERRPVFPIYTVDVPKGDLTLFQTGDIPKEAVTLDNDTVRFFIHPWSKKHYEKALGKYEWKKDFLATPTSSHRSLIAWNPKTNEAPFGVKSTLDANIGDTLRHLDGSQVRRAATVSALVNSIEPSTAKKYKAGGIEFIDEPLNLVLNQTNTGYAIRNLPDQPLMAYLSLYSKQPDGTTPLGKMIRNSGMAPKDFIAKNIIEPMVRQYYTLAFEQGLLLQPHEQNAEQLLDKNGAITGTHYYRDFGGMRINPELRKQAGHDMGFLPDGVDKDFSKWAKHANPVDYANIYIRDSNFYALQQSQSKEFPEITKAWVQEQYAKYTAKMMQKYTGISATNLAEARSAYNKYLRGANCETQFRNFSAP